MEAVAATFMGGVGTTIQAPGCPLLLERQASLQTVQLDLTRSTILSTPGPSPCVWVWVFLVVRPCTATENLGTGREPWGWFHERFLSAYYVCWARHSGPSVDLSLSFAREGTEAVTAPEQRQFPVRARGRATPISGVPCLTGRGTGHGGL